MLIPAPPISNSERQRQFQWRNPGCDRRRKARRRAAIEAMTAAKLAAKQAAASEPRVMLALPAPLEQVVIPGMTIPMPTPEREPIVVHIRSFDARDAA